MLSDFRNSLFDSYLLLFENLRSTSNHQFKIIYDDEVFRIPHKVFYTT